MRYVRGEYVRESEYAPPPRWRQSEYTWTTNRDIPSGRMRIIAYSPYGSVSWEKRWDEAKSATLNRQVRTIAEEIASEEPRLVEKLEEAGRQAEIRHQQYLAEEERRRREEDRRRIEQSVIESKADLLQVITRWADITNIERFLVGVEERAESLPEAEKVSVLERWRSRAIFLAVRIQSTSSENGRCHTSATLRAPQQAAISRFDP